MSLRADVVVPVYRDVEMTRRCLESVLTHSGTSLGRLIAVNDRSPEVGMQPMLEALQAQHPQTVFLVQNAENQGFVSSCNRALALRTTHVVLLNNDTLVTEGWLEEMLEVLGSSDRVAAVTPLSNNATLCSVPNFDQPTPPETLQAKKLDLRSEKGPVKFTEVPTGVGFCLLLNHRVLNMVGGLDPVYGRGYNEENDWCARARRLGFVTLRANRALVYHLGSVSFGGERAELDRKNAAILHRRYPHYPGMNQRFQEGPEARIAANFVKGKMATPKVCFDLTHVHSKDIGTGVHAYELLKALAQRSDVEVSVRVETPEQNAAAKSLGIAAHPAKAPLHDFQAYHFPSQVFRRSELETLLGATCPAVITYQDLIAFRNPTVFETFSQYEQYRSFSYASLQGAQAVIAISEHNRNEIIRDLHVAPEKVHTVHLGVDAARFAERDEAKNRVRLESAGAPCSFFLYTGSDYPHKNIPLLLAAHALFRARNPSGPELVLVGVPSHSKGSLYDRTQRWPLGVRYLGAVETPTLTALMQEATAFLYPTAYEGFGLPVLEAMAAGTPLIASSLTSVPEVVGDAGLSIKDFSIQEVAGLMEKIHRSPELRMKLRGLGLARAKLFSWKETARKTAAVYLEAAKRPTAASFFQRQMLRALVSSKQL